MEEAAIVFYRLLKNLVHCIMCSRNTDTADLSTIYTIRRRLINLHRYVFIIKVKALNYSYTVIVIKVERII